MSHSSPQGETESAQQAHTTAEQQAEAAFQHTQDLQRDIADLNSLAQADSIDSQKLRELASRLSARSDDLSTSLRVALPADALRYFTTARAISLCEETFGIPELLEAMLSHLPMFELLRAQQVCKRWKATIEGSVTLRRLLSWTPTSPDGHFRLPFGYDEGFYGNGFSFDFNSGRYRKPETLDVCAGFGDHPREGDGDFSSSIGANIRMMFVCQSPVVKSMKVCTGCCDPNMPGKGGIVVTNPAGLRVGDLFDAYDRLQRDHQDCEISLYDPESQRRVGVYMHGKAKLRPDDRYVLAKQKREAELHAQRLANIELQFKAYSYRQAKQHSAAGSAFPSFKEWVKTFEMPEDFAYPDLEMSVGYELQDSDGDE